MIVGFGASLGAVVGSILAERLIEPVGVNNLMLLGAGLIIAQLVLTNSIDRVERHRRQPAAAATPQKTPASAASTNGFAMVLRTRYLLLIALMLMTLNWVNTTGEYILGSIVKETATGMVAAGQAGSLTEAQLIGDFYARYFTLVNGLGLFLQLFVVSRIVKYLGVPWAVMIHPAIAFTAYNILVFVPTLSAVLGAKVAENSTDYSLNNTVRNMLFLPCTYEQKFSAKQAIDSFFVRMGDVLSAGLVFIGTTVVALSPQGFAMVNAVLVVVWLILAWRVGRYYHKVMPDAQPAPSAAA